MAIFKVALGRRQAKAKSAQLPRQGGQLGGGGRARVLGVGVGADEYVEPKVSLEITKTRANNADKRKEGNEGHCGWVPGGLLLLSVRSV